MTFIRFFCIFVASISLSSAAAATYEWRQNDKSLSLLNQGKVVWQFNAHAGEMKPYFHPLATIDGGSLTDFRPADHPWHRGAWFSFKLINGVNYWEEDSVSGLSNGRTKVVSVIFAPHSDFSADLDLTLSYYPAGSPELLSERRLIKVSSPDKNGNYRIDWQMQWTARAPLKLQRTPLQGEPGGVAYGGYAGLSARLNPALKSWTFLNSEGSRSMEAHGSPGKWISIGGRVGDRTQALTLFDHPRNLTFPSASFVEPTMPFLSPAFLFHKEIELAGGQTFELFYRMLVSNAESLGTSAILLLLGLPSLRLVHSLGTPKTA